MILPCNRLSPWVLVFRSILVASPLLIAGLFCIGFFCQWLAWRSKLPAILFLLASGLILGPLTNWLDPDQLMGDLLFPFVSLAVAVILFEGALTLRFDEVRSLGKVVQRLVTYGALICWAVSSLACHMLFDLSWGIAILFGAITVVTGPTVIVPMLRTVRPTANIAKILRWEGIVIDPIGALLAVVVFEFLTSMQSGHALTHSAITFLKVVVIGFGLGALAGWSLGLMLKKHWIPDYLLNLATLTQVFLAFAVSNYFAHESGLLAVTVMGMWLANTKNIHIEEILNFKENLSIVLISGLFILLAARISPADLSHLGLPVILLLVCMQLVARPLSVLFSTLGSDLNWRERALLGWIAPRGIVAAAVSALFALKLEEQAIPGAELLVPLTFATIVGTVLLQSLTAKYLARLLGVAESSPTGFLIVGANVVALNIGKALKDQGIDVILCDSSWSNIRKARMNNLATFYGNPVSEYADQKLDLVGFGKMIGLSPFRELNTIASLRYRTEFGKHNIYSMQTETDVSSSDKHRIAADHQGGILFNRFLTYSKLADLMDKGAEIKKTKLSSEFTFEQFLLQNSEAAIPLFAISPKGKVDIFAEGHKPKTDPGYTVLSLNYGQIDLTGSKAAPQPGL